MNRLDRTEIEALGSEGSRKLDPARTRREILAAARAEFADKGFSGARVDEIAARTATAKRMIYYYFGSKEDLYVAVLEDLYAAIRATEAALDLDHLSPHAAMVRLVEFTFDYDRANGDFVRIVSGENMHHARYLKRSPTIRDLNADVLAAISRILRRGRADGTFRRDVLPVDVHFMISGLCFFRVANQHTFSAIFGCDLAAEATAERHKRMIRDAVLNYLCHDDGTGA